MALPQKPEMQGTRFQVEADSLFLLGDNRNGSTDSRHSGVGSVHRDCLLGRAVAVIWPLDRLRLLRREFPLQSRPGAGIIRDRSTQCAPPVGAGGACQCREEFEARAGAPQQPPQEGAEEQEKLPQEELFYWLQTLVTAIVCIVLVFTFLGRITRVVGHSMDDTLADGELLAVWSLGYEPEQGDMVVLNKTTADFLEGEAIVKRVIALEGQTVDIDYDAGTVAVDGQVLDEPYILEEMLWPSSSHMPETHFEVPEDSIFVMGDNRNGSTDSRHEWLGAIDEDYILGQAVAVLWPLGRIGLL